jgi:hypothetical protein
LDDLEISSTDAIAFTLNQADNHIADRMPMPETSDWNQHHYDYDQQFKWHFPFTRGWWTRPILI